jgi:hypothetical protein
MLKKIAGYFLAGIGFISFTFFINYKGSVISFSTLWFIVSLLIGIIGVYLISTSKTAKISRQEKYNEKRVAQLKQNGEKILLTKDNCEIRENNYYEEGNDARLHRIQEIDALYDPNENYTQKFIEQTVIVYSYNNGFNKIRMTSQSFPFGTETLKYYIENKSLVLYVSPLDKSDYAFEIIP